MIPSLSAKWEHHAFILISHSDVYIEDLDDENVKGGEDRTNSAEEMQGIFQSAKK